MRELSGTVASHCLFGLNACTKDCRSVSDKDCAADNISLYVMILSFFNGYAINMPFYNVLLN